MYRLRRSGTVTLNGQTIKLRMGEVVYDPFLIAAVRRARIPIVAAEGAPDA